MIIGIHGTAANQNICIAALASPANTAADSSTGGSRNRGDRASLDCNATVFIATAADGRTVVCRCGSCINHAAFNYDAIGRVMPIIISADCWAPIICPKILGEIRHGNAALRSRAAFSIWKDNFIISPFFGIIVDIAKAIVSF